jgi:hypothetical protein
MLEYQILPQLEADDLRLRVLSEAGHGGYDAGKLESGEKRSSITAGS